MSMCVNKQNALSRLAVTVLSWFRGRMEAASGSAAASVSSSAAPSAAPAPAETSLKRARDEEQAQDVLQLKAQVFAITHRVDTEVEADADLDRAIQWLMIFYELPRYASITTHTRQARLLVGELFVAENDPFSSPAAAAKSKAVISSALRKMVADLEDFLCMYTTARNRLGTTLAALAQEPAYSSWLWFIHQGCGKKKHDQCQHSKPTEQEAFRLFLHAVLMTDKPCMAIMQGQQPPQKKARVE